MTAARLFLRLQLFGAVPPITLMHDAGTEMKEVVKRVAVVVPKRIRSRMLFFP